MATVGHVIDLPKSKLGVDIDNGYEPIYENIYGKGKIIKDIKKAMFKDGNVYVTAWRLAISPTRRSLSVKATMDGGRQIGRASCRERV